MTFDFDAAHAQREREANAAHERLVREARSAGGSRSRVARARAAVGLRVVELGYALAGGTVRGGARHRARSLSRSIAVQPR